MAWSSYPPYYHYHYYRVQKFVWKRKHLDCKLTQGENIWPLINFFLIIVHLSGFTLRISRFTRLQRGFIFYSEFSHLRIFFREKKNFHTITLVLLYADFWKNKGLRKARTTCTRLKADDQAPNVICYKDFFLTHFTGMHHTCFKDVDVDIIVDASA